MMRRTSAFASAFAALLLSSACGGGGAPSVTAAPVIASITPTSGGVGGGTEVLIEGTGLANASTGTNELYFGAVRVSEFVVVNDTKIVCWTPPGTLGSVDVTVKKNHGTGVHPGAFTYHPPPVLTAIDPAEGTKLGGQAVRLFGSGFLDPNPGPTVVWFGSYIVQQFTVVDDGTIDAITPTAYSEEVVSVAVQNQNGKGMLVAAWRYSGLPPTVTGITPSYGPQAGGTRVTLTGTNFPDGPPGTSQVFIGTKVGMNVQRVDEDTLTFTTPSHPPATVDVKVVTANGEDTLPAAFTFVAAPAITAVTPTEGPVQGGTTVTLTGTGFLDFSPGVNSITIDGIDATDVQVVDDTTLTFVTPSHAPGKASIAHSNANGTSTPLTDAFFYFGLYVAEGKWGTSGNLYLVDPETGQTTSVGSLGMALTAMAFHPTTGVLYGVESAGQNWGSPRLVTIDPVTAKTTTIANLADNFADITFVGDTLVGMGMMSGPASIDLDNGARTSISSSPTWTNPSGIASNADGTEVRLCWWRELWSVNASTGSVSYIGYADRYLNAMTYHRGTLYGVDNTRSSCFLVTVSPSNASATLVGSLPDAIDAMASNSP